MSIAVEIDGDNREDGLASIKLVGTDVAGTTIDLPFKELYRSLGSPDAMARDLLMVAGRATSSTSPFCADPPPRMLGPAILK
jgi:hypothetical protein